MDSIYIAWKYISCNRIKSAVLVACITLISFRPRALQLLLDESERQLMSRAVSTPLIVGAQRTTSICRQTRPTHNYLLNLHPFFGLPPWWGMRGLFGALPHRRMQTAAFFSSLCFWLSSRSTVISPAAVWADPEWHR